MELSAKHFRVLFFILCFYLAAQIFQQFVLRWGPLSNGGGFEESLFAGQHPLNIARLFLILLSMFLMVVGYLLLTMRFNKTDPVLSVVSFVFFMFFLFIEIGYRSVELFQVILTWGHEFATATAEERALMIPHFHRFNALVEAIYFPLLFSHLLASICLFLISIKTETGKLIALAMGINGIRLLLRLCMFTPFGYVNIFSGFWYFPPVAIVFILLIVWTWKMLKRLPQ